MLLQEQATIRPSAPYNMLTVHHHHENTFTDTDYEALLRSPV